jgi:pyridoxal phosphate enzyme (YggS family)
MTGSRQQEISSALEQVHARIERARLAAHRSDPVALVVVTKTFPATDVDVLADLGVGDVAENRDQEARAKHDASSPAGQARRWHMIGQLQRNKANSVARWADVVESVDRLELVAPLGRAAVAAGRELDVLVQVSLDPEPGAGRGGADPGLVPALAEALAGEPALRLRGVMAVAPHPGDPGEAFERLRLVSERLRADHPEATVISAGMSGDLEEAVAHGATQVRIGGAVLGQRPPVQ